MKRLIIKIALLILPFGFLGLLGFEIISSFLNKDSLYTIDSNTHILILGDSHPECALNDSIIERSKNLAQSADTYFYIYYKLKKIIEANPTIDTVILGFPGNLFIPERDNWIYGEEYLGNKYPKYCHLIAIEDQVFLFFKNPRAFIIAFKDAMKTDYGFLFSTIQKVYNELNWGGYLYLVRDDIPKILNEQDKDITRPFYSKSISKLNYKNLNKIIDFCANHNKTIILLNVPIHKMSPRDQTLDLANFVKSDFGSVTFWDYSDYKLEDEEFGDLTHLNYKGAEKFSSIINLIINKASN
jgi:hypothetical protein